MKRFSTKSLLLGLLALSSNMVFAENDNSQIYTSITLDGTFYLDCTSQARATWAQIEVNVLSKIGTMGYTKGQFEAEYELDTYDDAGNIAVQFEKTMVDGRLTYVPKELTDTIGEVKYTILDNLGRQTNVLEWHFGQLPGIAKALTGKSDYDEAREQLIQTKGQGVAGQALTGTVRFVRKNLTDKDHAAVYVDLVIPAQNVYVAYADVQGKYVSSFYELNTNTMASSEATARELHVATPIPYITGGENLTGTELRDNLRQYFSKNMLAYDAERFTAFASDDVQLRFTLPSTAHGNAAFNADADGRWTVKGFSGHEYTLQLNATADAICVVSVDAGDDYAEPLPICRIENGTDIVWVNGIEACDILNHAGQYSNIDGTSTAATFMGSGQTFAAYIEIYTEACYEMLLNNRFFNVRFMRPIDITADSYNLWARLFEPYTFLLRDVVTISDWRGTEVAWQQHFRDVTDYRFVGHDFYGISRLFTSLDEIRSDYDLSDAERQQTTDTARIARMHRIADIPQLDGYVSVDLVPAVTNEEEHSDYPEDYRITYRNRGGEARKFHLYIPISVDYAWGQTEGLDGKPATQVVWAAIEIEATAAPTSISRVEPSVESGTTAVYTLDGRQVKPTGNPSLYVVKGKKFVGNR